MKFKSYYIDEDDNCENNEVSVLSCIHTFLANKLELKIAGLDPEINLTDFL